jgi:hypothetical protein
MSQMSPTRQLTPVISATHKVEIRRITFEAEPRQKVK